MLTVMLISMGVGLYVGLSLRRNVPTTASIATPCRIPHVEDSPYRGLDHMLQFRINHALDCMSKGESMWFCSGPGGLLGVPVSIAPAGERWVYIVTCSVKWGEEITTLRWDARDDTVITTATENYTWTPKRGWVSDRNEAFNRALNRWTKDMQTRNAFEHDGRPCGVSIPNNVFDGTYGEEV